MTTEELAKLIEEEFDSAECSDVDLYEALARFVQMEIIKARIDEQSKGLPLSQSMSRIKELEAQLDSKGSA